MESIENKYGICIGDVSKSDGNYGWFGTVIEGIDFFDETFGSQDVASCGWYHLKRDAVSFVRKEHKKLFPEQYKRKVNNIDIAKKRQRIK